MYLKKKCFQFKLVSSVTTQILKSVQFRRYWCNITADADNFPSLSFDALISMILNNFKYFALVLAI